MKYFLVLFSLLASSLMAQEPDSSSALFRMRETERDFAKASLMVGRNAAFAAFFAEKSAIFTDKWVTNGQQIARERKPAPYALKWEPEYMDISDSRDFGISTGPWEMQEYRPFTAPLATGYFLTVWEKQKNGAWKVILDGGSETPPIKNPQHNFSFSPGTDKPVNHPVSIDPVSSSDELSMRELKFLSAWEQNPSTSVFKEFSAANVRLQVNGHLPTTDPDSVSSIISSLDKNLTWKTEGSGAASSGDLGFTYGILQSRKGNDAAKGHYVRIWRKQSGMNWKIILEMLNLN